MRLHDSIRRGTGSLNLSASRYPVASTCTTSLLALTRVITGYQYWRESQGKHLSIITGRFGSQCSALCIFPGATDIELQDMVGSSAANREIGRWIVASSIDGAPVQIQGKITTLQSTGMLKLAQYRGFPELARAVAPQIEATLRAPVSVRALQHTSTEIPRISTVQTPCIVSTTRCQCLASRSFHHSIINSTAATPGSERTTSGTVRRGAGLDCKLYWRAGNSGVC